MERRQGLAEDVRYYGEWMRDEAQKRIGHLYPPVEITAEMAKETARPQAARRPEADGNRLALGTHSEEPEPSVSHVDVPLASTFILSSKEGKEAYVEPVIEGDRYRFTVKMGHLPRDAKNGTKLGRGANFQLSDVRSADRLPTTSRPKAWRAGWARG